MHRRDLLYALALHASPATPAFFSRTGRESLALLVEMVIPGAKAAGVDRFTELLLEDSDDWYREQFTDGLARLDRLALVKHETRFHRLDEQRRTALVISIAGSRFYEQLRAIVAFGYYTSKDGMTAIGWKQHPGVYPGCKHEEHE